MTTTDSLNAKEAYLKVGNYKENILEAVNEAKDYISTTNCPILNIDISGLNMLDALKVCVLSSTYHFAKYCNNGRIKWFVKDEQIKEQIEMLKLDNIEIEVKRVKRSYTDFGERFTRRLSICR